MKSKLLIVNTICLFNFLINNDEELDSELRLLRLFLQIFVN